MLHYLPEHAAVDWLVLLRPVQPRRLKDLARAHAAFGALPAHPAYQSSARLGHVLPFAPLELKWRKPDVLDHFVQAVTIERHPPTQQYIQDDAAAEDVALLVVAGAAEHFGWHVIRGATYRPHVLAWREANSKTEVDQLDDAGREIPSGAVLEQEVFELEIAMRDASAMHVVHRVHHLAEDVTSFRLTTRAQALPFFPAFAEHVKKIASAALLHDNVQVAWVHEHLEYSNDVRVVELGMDLGLIEKCPGACCGVSDDALNDASAAALQRPGGAHNAEAALAQNLAHLIAVHDTAVRAVDNQVLMFRRGRSLLEYRWNEDPQQASQAEASAARQIRKHHCNVGE
mmetsp:Transcript_23622/g.60077  ORF Transcript_23622/g.60077 Transcript_23622/m.60077 type:complete len:343 (+) Transcript_23622:588-1616(+)